MYIMSTNKCKKVDKYTIDEIGIPSIVLMENAANEVVNKVINLRGKFIVFCGNGNNGGDGLAIARKLILNNKDVHVVIISRNSKYSKDFSINLNILKQITTNITYVSTDEDIKSLIPIISNYNITIDCIFGVGLNRNLDSFYIKLINIINECSDMKVSIDVPSGLNADSGEIMGASIEADITYTFEVVKRGFIEYKALSYLGELNVLNIGIPEYVKRVNSENIFILNRDQYSKLLKKRSLYGHKGKYGKIAILAGSKGYTGAAYIVTESCVKSGAGLTTLVSSKYVQDKLSCKLIEAMTLDIEEVDKVKKILNDSDVIAIGPGMTEEKVYKDILSDIGSYGDKFFVVDVGALQLMSRDKNIMNVLKGKAIFTPHPGEMARIIGKSISFVEDNRIEVAKRYAKENEIIVVLKGYNTVITDGNDVYINNSGNSKMASGGMGDCLTGIISALIGQRHSLINSALLGTYIHGLAGEFASHEKYCTVASEVIENISKVMNYIVG
ncbi:NAD(P)H-hydrate dehydratase [Clostridium sp. DSM 100503]|uniref:NAD(P)H-hydrate dehydratase n=1 Tax=Clostridium sp. DSM 100503 TaxID=2963282 RepID=UPI00214A2482|nr:NAD(P)H-hydrate dehydratase [Clostridium sp. DSM 100503]MCR1952253.1 NAD(P)H-hydrate dehydratase [Clostridium sp. DSM 100503]